MIEKFPVDRLKTKKNMLKFNKEFNRINKI